MTDKKTAGTPPYVRAKQSLDNRPGVQHLEPDFTVMKDKVPMPVERRHR